MFTGRCRLDPGGAGNRPVLAQATFRHSCCARHRFAYYLGMLSICTTTTVLALAAILPLRAAIPEPVSTEHGKVSGVTGLNSEVRIFKGIPFAAPPVRECPESPG